MARAREAPSRRRAPARAAAADAPRGRAALVLAARRRAYEALREAVLAARLRTCATSEGYDALLERLEPGVRDQLGPGTEIDRDDERGGIVAHNGSRTIERR